MMKWVSRLDLFPGETIYGFEDGKKSYIVAAGMVIEKISPDGVKVKYHYGETELVSPKARFLARR